MREGWWLLTWLWSLTWSFCNRVDRLFGSEGGGVDCMQIKLKFRRPRIRISSRISIWNADSLTLSDPKLNILYANSSKSI